MKRKDWLILLAGLVIGTALGVFLIFGLGFWSEMIQGNRFASGSELTNSAVVGSAAPDFELRSLTGESVRLSDLKGKPVLLNFWATWCEPCKLEMPAIQQLYDQHAGEFAVLAINNDEPEGDVRNFAEQLSLSFDILLDPGAKVQDLYRVRGYPTSFLVDSDGNIRVHHIGLMTSGQLGRYLQNVGIEP